MVETLRAEINPPITDAARRLVMNLTVTGAPGGDVKRAWKAASSCAARRRTPPSA